jgi:hypothetical protein
MVKYGVSIEDMKSSLIKEGLLTREEIDKKLEEMRNAAR